MHVLDAARAQPGRERGLSKLRLVAPRTFAHVEHLGHALAAQERAHVVEVASLVSDAEARARARGARTARSVRARGVGHAVLVGHRYAQCAWFHVTASRSSG